MITVAAYTAGVNAPHARFRVRQYIPALERLGIRITEFPAALGSHPPVSKPIRPLWALGTLAQRVPQIRKSYYHDLTLLQREILSRHDTLEAFTSTPRVLDVDDAIFVGGGARVARRLAKRCALVICGNDYLADEFRQWNQRVVVVPTAVDTNRFIPGQIDQAPNQPTIGWIGTSSNFKYLYQVEEALRAVLELRPAASIRIVADGPPRFRRIASERIEYIPWTADQEVAAIQSMSVGIMPLADGSWERGKCSYKMLQYMACGVPVVVSPVGMNIEVLSMGTVGLAATTSAEWMEALLTVLDAPSAHAAMGRTGRAIAERHFSIDVIAPRLAASLTEMFDEATRRPLESSRAARTRADSFR